MTETYEPQIILEIVEGKQLVFSDNGQGLTEDEIHQFLDIIGESSKRKYEQKKNESDYIGRFGIGLLSCFMVSDEISIIILFSLLKISQNSFPDFLKYII